MPPVSTYDRLSYVTRANKVSHYLIGEISKNISLSVIVPDSMIVNKDFTYFAETSRCDNIIKLDPDTGTVVVNKI